MEKNIIVDAGFLVALLSRRDSHHEWAVVEAARHPPPWSTCEAVLSEVFQLLGAPGRSALSNLLRRRSVAPAFDLATNLQPVLTLMQKYATVPMSFADSCLVRMTETRAVPVILTTDSDFRSYRRHSRQVIPCILPSDV